MAEKVKNTLQAILLQDCGNKTSRKTSGQEDQVYLSKFFIAGQLEEDFEEDQWSRRSIVPLQFFLL